MSDPISPPSSPLAPVSNLRADPRLSRWVRGVFHSSVLERIELHHGGSAGSSHVETWTTFESRTPDQIIRDIYQSASEDAEAFHGPQKYVALAFVQNQRAPSRVIFRVEGQPWEQGDDFEGSEPPNGKGLTSQLMRHTEGAVRLALMSSRQMTEMMARNLERQAQREEAFMEKHLKVLELHEDLLNKNHERGIEREDKASMRQIKMAVASQGMQLLPTLLAKFMPGGGGALPLLTNLVGSLSEDQIMTIMSNLSETQKAQFLEVYTILREQQEAMAKAGGGNGGSSSGG